MEEVSDGEERVIATGKYLDEGFNDVRLDTLFSLSSVKPYDSAISKFPVFSDLSIDHLI